MFNAEIIINTLVLQNVSHNKIAKHLFLLYLNFCIGKKVSQVLAMFFSFMFIYHV